ncbi:glutaredoxin family protein [Candidatus Contubernalis alkaliaceticus]|uniref:glutaredoxin family protein n=1 Tax=Candidatus Contubernalis alkaliaceticus TaxID=338645 RepID=UPI001F4C4623|nr:Uxx-star family glutaredoxin-like (seleno)protein [Candidatus Contubernalis alkalaceticus]UNC92688.1 glutathione S-transferase N-terminal domain-containing protein [Candidatus Contubernalis alkalaceticus]
MNEKVIVYTTPTCPFCDTVKEFLSKKGVSYVEYDVSEDENARQEMMDKSGRMAVPTMVINNEVIVGFDQEKIDELIH